MTEQKIIHHHSEVHTLHNSGETCRSCNEMELYDILTAAAVMLLFILVYRIKKFFKK